MKKCVCQYKCFLWNKEEYGEAELVPNNWSTSRKLWSLQLLFCLGGLMACLSYTYSDICINATLQTKHHNYGSLGVLVGSWILPRPFVLCSILVSLFHTSRVATVWCLWRLILGWELFAWILQGGTLEQLRIDIDQGLGGGSMIGNFDPEILSHIALSQYYWHLAASLTSQLNHSLGLIL